MTRPRTRVYVYPLGAEPPPGDPAGEPGGANNPLNSGRAGRVPLDLQGDIPSAGDENDGAYIDEEGAANGPLDPADEADPRDGKQFWFDRMPDQRGIESAMTDISAQRRRDDALRFLDQLSPEEEQKEAAAARESAATRTQQSVTGKGEGSTTAGAIAKDVAGGAVETPIQIIGGVRDAAQSMVDLAEWSASGVAKAALTATGGEDADIAKLDQAVTPKLPGVKEAKTVTGGVVRSVAQFLTGFGAVGKVMGKAPEAASFVRSIIQGAGADAVAFSAHEKRLSDLIEQVPELQNPVTEFLKTDPTDGEAEGRFKRAIEGLALGGLTEGLLRGVRLMRDMNRARAEGSPEQAAARAAAAPREAAELSLLGDEKARLVSKGPAKGTDLGVPDDVAAKALTAKGLTPLSDHNPVYINFARINSADDVKQVMNDTAKAFAADIDAAKRGVRSNREMLNAAGAVDAWKTLTARRVGDALNAEQSVAVRNLWEASASKLMSVAQEASTKPTPENLYQFRKMLAIHETIQQQVLGARAETARALQSWKIPAGSDGASKLQAIEGLLATHGGEETARLLAHKVAALKDLPGGMGALEDVVSKGALAKSVEVAKEVWVNALLSNPKTHLVNVMGNTASTLMMAAERFAARGYSRALGSGEVQPGEAMAAVFATKQAVRDGVRLFGQALKTGESQFGAQTAKTADAGFPQAITAENLRGIGHNGGPQDWLGTSIDTLGTMVNLPTRFLNAEDDFFKAIGYRMELHARAFRQAHAEKSGGLLADDLVNARIAELVANPTPDIKMAAIDAARYATFTSKPGAFVNGINTIEQRMAAAGSPAGQIGSLAMKLIIPFRNTPANLVKFTFERTPLAPLMQNYREAIARGGADADIARARMAMGTMVLLAVMDLADDGHITGTGPSSRKSDEKGERQTKMRAGWQPYSIKVGDRYFSYSRTDPIGMTLMLGANISELINNSDIDEDKAETIQEVAIASAFAFGASVLEKSYMSGVSDLMDTFHNTSRGSDFVERIVANIMVPSVVNEGRRQADPYMRYSHDLVTKLMDRTPGLSDNLPPARDMWGRQRTYQSGLGMTYDAISPIASKLYDPEPIDREALAEDFNLTMPNWKIGQYGLRNRPEVYSRYLEVRGQLKPSDMATNDNERAALRAFVEARESGRDDAKKKAREGIARRSGVSPEVAESIEAAAVAILKYGDTPLLETLNAIIDGKHAMSAEYKALKGGHNEERNQFVRRVISDYGKAAKAKVLKEFKLDDAAGKAADGND